MILGKKSNYFLKFTLTTICLVGIVFYNVLPVFANAPYVASDVLGQGTFTQNTNNNENPKIDGLNGPYGIALDSVNHRLFTIDKNNNRILGFNLNTDNTPIDDNADYVFGQNGEFVTGLDNGGNGIPTADTLAQPEGIAIDVVNNRLWVSDTNNNRILGYNLNSSGAPDDTTADYVFGQAGDFTTNSSGLTADNLQYPSGIFVDTVNNRLFVSDTANNRILYYNLNSSGAPDDTTADYVFGQSGSFTTDATCPPFTATKVCQARDLVIDYTNHRLFVAHSYLDRVIAFDLDSTNVPLDDTADYVFGQAGSFTTFGCGVGITAAKLCFPNGLVIDEVNNRLFVSDTNNSRVLGYNLGVGGVPTDTTADYVFGQAGDFTTDISDVTVSALSTPSGIAIDPINNYFYISDSNNNRILGYSLSAGGIPSNTDADYVFGQDGSFTANNANNLVSGPNAIGFNGSYSTIIDPVNHKLFVLEINNNRVVIFNLDSNNDFTEKTADYVLGQADFVSNDFCSTVDATFLCTPRSMSLDSVNHRLFILDSDYNRVLQFNLDTANAPIDNIADKVLGQGDLASGPTDVTNFTDSQSGAEDTGFNESLGIALDTVNHRLFVSDTSNNRVVFFNLDESNDINDNVMDGVIGQDDLLLGSSGCNKGLSTDIDTLCTPKELVIDSSSNRLFVSDENNQRVLVFNINPDTFVNGLDASFVIGQADFVSDNPNGGFSTNDSGFDDPRGLFYNAQTQRLYVAEEDNHRIMAFNVSGSNLANGMSAESVIGQADFVSNDSNITNVNFDRPLNFSIDTTLNKVYVADSENNRVLQFKLINITKSSLSGGTANTSYSDTVTTANSQGSVSYALSSGSLPSGLSLNSSSGTISGTPTTAGSYTFTIQAIDDNGTAGEFIDAKEYTIVISAAASTGGSVPVYILQAMSDVLQNKTEVPDVKIDKSSEENKNVDQNIENMPATKKFSEFLRISNKKTDVKDLQIFLNSQGNFVSRSGPGSPGNETNFFGKKTKAALALYQELYRDDILKPLNLKKGTGFFGPYTMRFVNAILEKQN